MRREQTVIRFSHETLDSIWLIFLQINYSITVNWCVVCVLVHDTFGSSTCLLQVQVYRWVRRLY